MCEYCKDSECKPFFDNENMSAWINIELNVIDITLVASDAKYGEYEQILDGIDINYCPMCGRKLKEDSDD